MNVLLLLMLLDAFVVCMKCCCERVWEREDFDLALVLTKWRWRFISVGLFYFLFMFCLFNFRPSTF